ncbi:ABC transporter ATP-binding protein [Microbacterium sp. NPDC006705]|uniref:ABC transporter ATP-binding protein n=1 Tax=unclassified Microbacterium TaxID=2609290 RepID=UPI0033929B9D
MPDPFPSATSLAAESVTLAYDGAEIVRDLSVRIEPGSFTVIIGPNACGKSTLLRGLSRLLAPRAGNIVLDGRAITELPAKEVARRLGLLPQSAIAPEGITVRELVGRGRYPHQNLFRQWSAADDAAVDEALAATGTTQLASRAVEALSGGQRQRVWVAMVLAQQTDLLLLDEPTTFLDVAHQVDLMELFAELNERGRTIVAVLHDLNHAARYASRIVAMRDGRILAEGPPAEVITSERVQEVFGLANIVVDDPVTGGPLVVPLRARRPRAVTGEEAP